MTAQVLSILFAVLWLATLAYFVIRDIIRRRRAADRADRLETWNLKLSKYATGLERENCQYRKTLQIAERGLEQAQQKLFGIIGGQSDQSH